MTAGLNLLAAEVVERFYLFLWPMLRISALLATAPPFSTSAFTVRLRVLMAMVLAWFVYPQHDWPTIDPASAAGVLEIGNQIFIGATMGLTLQVVVAALVVAGQALSAAMGLSMANMIDPSVGNVPVLSQALIVFSTLIFMGFGGHALLLSLVLQSFETLPIGVSVLDLDAFGRVIRWSAMMFLGAVLLALPVLVMLLFINIGLGVVTRAATSLNIFAVGLPALIAVGVLGLVMSMGGIGERIEWLWLRGFEQLRALLRIA